MVGAFAEDPEPPPSLPQATTRKASARRRVPRILARRLGPDMVWLGVEVGGGIARRGSSA
jgi:hypothetical protein